MERIFNSFETVFFFSVMSVLVGRLFYLIALRPYRTTIACWYMKRYSSHYRTAKHIFDELLRKYDEVKKSSKTLQECYAEFYREILSNPHFRGSNAVYLDVILQDENDFIDTELFTFFQGKGIFLHKIFVTFNFSDGIHLVSIELLYNEERGPNSFFYSLEKKEFPPDESGDPTNIPIDDPVLELQY